MIENIKNIKTMFFVCIFLMLEVSLELFELGFQDTLMKHFIVRGTTRTNNIPPLKIYNYFTYLNRGISGETNAQLLVSS